MKPKNMPVKPMPMKPMHPQKEMAREMREMMGKMPAPKKGKH